MRARVRGGGARARGPRWWTPCARAPRRRPSGDLGAVTVVGAGDGAVLVARYLGRNAEHARAFLHDTWRLVRPALLGREAVSPRVWAT